MCSYCGCRTFRVVERLSEEHEGIINALGDVLRHAGGGPLGDDPMTVRTLAELLDRHTRFEERGLFAELQHDDVLGPHVRLLCGEHEAIDELIRRLEVGDHEAAPQLEQLLRRHIDREENGLFPAAAITLDGDAWERAELAG